MENLLFSPSAAGHYLRISQLTSGLYLTRLDFFLQRSWAMYIVPFYLYYIFAYYYYCACTVYLLEWCLFLLLLLECLDSHGP